MVKKLSLTLILLLLMGCANLSEKKQELPLKEQFLVKQIDDWKLTEAQTTLSQIKSTLDEETTGEYTTLILRKQNNVKELNRVIEILKSALSKNQFFIIERYLDVGITNKIKLNELKKMDLSNSNIFSGKPSFNKNKATVLTVINFFDESFYLEIVFNLKNDQWRIINFYERG